MKLKSHTLIDVVQTLYTVTEQNGVAISFIEIVNTSVSPIFINLYINLQGNDYPILPRNQELLPGSKLEDDGSRYLPYGAQVRGKASANGAAKMLMKIED